MFKINEVIMHVHDVCKIKELVKNYRDGEDYYRLSPLSDEGLVIYTPVANSRGMMRKIISRKEAEALIADIPSIQPLETDDRQLINEYKALVSKGDHRDYVRIIKTTYLRNELRTESNKKLNENDKTYFRLAEHILYSEIGAALGMDFDETKKYITDKVAAAIPPLPENVPLEETAPLQEATA